MKPQGIKLNRADGTTINCELIHTQTDENGTDTWELANIIYQHGDKITLTAMKLGDSIKFQSAVEPDSIELTWENP